MARTIKQCVRDALSVLEGDAPAMRGPRRLHDDGSLAGCGGRPVGYSCESIGGRADVGRAAEPVCSGVLAGAGSMYVEGVQDPAFTQRYLALSKSVAAAFAARYAKLQFDWYLTFEADLNQLYYPSVERAYRALLVAETQTLAAVRPHTTFAWSPAFWYPYSIYSTNTAGM